MVLPGIYTVTLGVLINVYCKYLRILFFTFNGIFGKIKHLFVEYLYIKYHDSLHYIRIQFFFREKNLHYRVSALLCLTTH